MNHWGRIFFQYDAHERLIGVCGQSLANHVNNCKELLERFQPWFFHSETKERLLKAVELHDQGKRETFRIGTNDEGTRFIYSFAGHRFRIPGNDPYIDGLIRSHHQFSVEQINRERARLQSEEDRKRFADDLYLLCMADQIEAELAVKTVEKKRDIARTFMEFTTEKAAESANIYRVIPWPFRK
jgi:CRISPR-associated endonuclease/helicase Cas3